VPPSAKAQDATFVMIGGNDALSYNSGVSENQTGNLNWQPMVVMILQILLFCVYSNVVNAMTAKAQKVLCVNFAICNSIAFLQQFLQM
jgi:hypothetical protein